MIRIATFPWSRRTPARHPPARYGSSPAQSAAGRYWPRPRMRRIRSASGSGETMPAGAESFDYIVTGAGSAGCAVAARLSEFGALSRAAAGGRRQGPQSVDPHPDGLLAGLRQSARQLDVRERAGGAARRPQTVSAARQGARRHQFDQRHGVYARQCRGLRRMAPARLHRLGLGQRAALLQEGRTPGTRRQRVPWHRWPAACVRSAAPIGTRGSGGGGGDPGGVAADRRLQRRPPGRRWVFPEHHRQAPPLEHRDRLSASGAQPRQPGGAPERTCHAHPDRGRPRRGRHLCQRRGDAHRARRWRGDRQRRRFQLAATAATVRHRSGRACCRRWASR